MCSGPLPDDDGAHFGDDWASCGDDGFPFGDDSGWCAEWEEAAMSLPEITDAELLSRMSRTAHEADLLFLASIDLGRLIEPEDRIAFFKAVERVASLVAALRSDAVVAFAGAVPAGAYLPELHMEQELSIAARMSRYSAGRQIETARALETAFPSFKAALRAGDISQGHCTVLVDRTRPVRDPEALAAIERVALPKAKRMTPGEFARECNALVIKFDRDAAARTRRARQERRVSVRELEDGMGYLGLTHEWSTIAAIEKVVRADGRRLQLARREADAANVAGSAGSNAVTDSDSDSVADSDTDTGTDSDTDTDTDSETSTDCGTDSDEGMTADLCRADALAARLLGVVGDDGETTWGREAPVVETQVVIDLATLRGENDNPCLLDGMPVPADLAREIAGYAKAFRRMVTDPITGHLLDYGQRIYLPEPLRNYVLARDGGCRTPGCTTQAASRMQMDHPTPFPEGPSNPANAGGLCITCHQLKTDGHSDIDESRADGSCTWRSGWGQTVHVPPRAFLPAHEDPPPPPGSSPHQEPPPPEDPPPF